MSCKPHTAINDIGLVYPNLFTIMKRGRGEQKKVSLKCIFTVAVVVVVGNMHARTISALHPLVGTWTKWWWRRWRCDAYIIIMVNRTFIFNAKFKKPFHPNIYRSMCHLCGVCVCRIRIPWLLHFWNLNIINLLRNSMFAFRSDLIAYIYSYLLYYVIQLIKHLYYFIWRHYKGNIIEHFMALWNSISFSMDLYNMFYCR